MTRAPAKTIRLVVVNFGRPKNVARRRARRRRWPHRSGWPGQPAQPRLPRRGHQTATLNEFNWPRTLHEVDFETPQSLPSLN